MTWQLGTLRNVMGSNSNGAFRTTGIQPQL